MSVDVKRLAELAKIHMGEDSLGEMEKDMTSIIALMDILKYVELASEGEGGLELPLSALRHDVVGESLPVSLLTGQAPNGEFSIPKVVE